MQKHSNPEIDRITHVITEADKSSERLDKLLSEKIADLSRTQVRSLFELGLITASCGHALSLSKLPPVGTTIMVDIPPPEDYELKPEPIPLHILFEDDELLFVNKVAGMVVHPAAGNWNGTLVHALLYHCSDLAGIGNVRRPGIVHRLDKGTSGVMVVAKTQKSHQRLVELFKNHDLKRMYEALILWRKIPTQGTLKSFIDRSNRDRKKMTALTNKGKEAITFYKILRTHDRIAHVECTLETGRTHQIRVHLAELLKTPVLNDHLYANPAQHLKNLPEIRRILADYPYPLLHAKTLGLNHPINGSWLEFTVPAPSPFIDLVELLNQDKP